MGRSVQRVADRMVGQSYRRHLEKNAQCEDAKADEMVYFGLREP